MQRLPLLLVLTALGLLAHAEDSAAKWIWTTERPHAEGATRYFRIEFDLADDCAKATLAISCDNKYLAHVNGQKAGDGDDWQAPVVHPIGKLLRKGRNCIAIAGTNQEGTAGLLAEARIVLNNGAEQRIATSNAWTFSLAAAEGWNDAGVKAGMWSPVIELGPYAMGPWNLADWPSIASGKSDTTAKFQVPEGFVVDDFATNEEAGSAVALAFNAKGQLLCAAAGSKASEIRVLLDKDRDGVCEGVTVYQPKTYCHGMLVVGNDLYAIADGNLLLLPDKNGDNQADSMTKLYKNGLGGMAEHGPHGIIHGADGMLYFILGNSANFQRAYVTTPASPVQFERLYWGNTLPPQSSQGFMDGVGPPGGIVVRADLAAKHNEIFACGFRNAYDIAFNPDGEIFSFDSDMEWDIGLPWYRPVRTCHVTSGAEFGWRFGGGKWKSYYPDSIPGMVDTGRGSPTGVEIYDHTAFPPEYRGAQFHCDWALGKIICVFPKRAGATYTGDTIDFMAVNKQKRGVSFPVTDCVVAPDGSLYVSYGGRDAKGGVYRVRYTGPKAAKSLFSPQDLQGLSEPLAAAVNQPQPLAPYSRAAIAEHELKLGADWKTQLAAAVRDTKRPAALRVRAANCLTMNGAPMDTALVQELLKDPTADLRAKAAWHCGLSGNAACMAALTETLKDSDAWVLRRACESFQRHPSAQAADGLVALLGHSDRFVRYHARTALIRLPAATWTEKAVSAATPRAKAEGLLTWAQSFQSPRIDPQLVAPSFEKMLAVGSELLGAELQGETALTAERAVQLTLLARQDRAAIPTQLKSELAEKCLALLKRVDPRVAMEAAEILGFLQEPSAVPALLAKGRDAALPREQRVHYAVCVVNIPTGWSREQYLQIMEFALNPGQGSNGHAFEGNMQQCFARAMRHMPSEIKAGFFTELPDKQLSFALTALGAITPTDFEPLRRRLAATKDQNLQQQIITLISSLKNKDAFVTLEGLLDETKPQYDILLTHLMRSNEPQAGKYAIKAMLSLSRGVATEGLLRTIDLFERLEKPPELYYGLIVCASRATPEIRDKALQTLQRWTFVDKPTLPPQSSKQVEFWQAAFQTRYPDFKGNFPELSGEGYQNATTFEKLLDFVRAQPPAAGGNAQAGKELFKAQRCATCHSYKGEGQMLGPDLSDVSKRFDYAKILEDVVYPSRVVDARYRQMNFKLKDGQRLTGFISDETAETRTIVDTNGVKTLVKIVDIEQAKVGDQSIMPQGLIDTLKPEQIRDLLKYLESDGK